MKKRYTKGARLLLVMTIPMLFFSYSIWWNAFNDTRDVKDLYQEGSHRFSGYSGNSIIKVLGIEELDLADQVLGRGENFYMVETEQAFLILKSNREDLKKVIGDRLADDEKLRKFTKEDIYSWVDVVPERTKGKRKRTYIRAELKEKFRQSLTDSVLIRNRLDELSAEYGDSNVFSQKLNERPLYLNVYINPSDMSFHIIGFSMASGFSLITLSMIFVAVRRIRWARESYRRLFAAYPEIEGDMERLLLDADYSDKKLKVLVYKNAIIVYNNIFEFEEMNKIDEIVFNKESKKGKAIDYTINIMRDSRKPSYDIRIGKRKEAQKHIRDLGDYLSENHSLQVTYKF